MLYGGIEAGGTKMNCAVADQEGKIVAQKRILTGRDISKYFSLFRSICFNFNGNR